MNVSPNLPLVYTYEPALTALADQTRRSIFEILREGPRSVGDLARVLPVSRPAVSQHLKVLLDARLVQAESHGTRRYYRIDPRGLEPLRRYLEEFWDDVLAAFRRGTTETMEDPMTHATPVIEPVRRSVDVRCSPSDAFRIFVDDIDSWWPLATHSVGQEKAVSCLFEGRDGGRIYETHADGSLHLWGTVTTWQPPTRVVFSWHPGRDANTAQEVELRFLPFDNGTRVELEHRQWEKLGDRASETRDAYQSGWAGVLARYVARCAEAAAD